MGDRYFDISAFAYAHRGLWGGRVPENSLAAFHAAREHGLGVELDVRLSADSVVHVFHDPQLDRMCGVAGPLDALTAEELARTFLPNGFSIPTLEAVLSVMADFPVLIELKVEGPGGDLADRVAALIEGKPGRLAAMSFEEATAARLCELVTDRPVGLLIGPEPLLGVDTVRSKVARARAIGCDYLAPHLTSLAVVEEAGGSLPLVTWTLRDPAELEIARRHSAAPIFEGIDPSLVAGLAKPSQTPI
jgi:glycerophosphoryl diester phosphodiesterase